MPVRLIQERQPKRKTDRIQRGTMITLERGALVLDDSAVRSENATRIILVTAVGIDVAQDHVFRHV
jgi:hypothetical protein